MTGEVLKEISEKYETLDTPGSALVAWEIHLLVVIFGMFRRTGKWLETSDPALKSIVPDPESALKRMGDRWVNIGSQRAMLTLEGMLACKFDDSVKDLASRALSFFKKEGRGRYDVNRIMQGMDINELEAHEIMAMFQPRTPFVRAWSPDHYLDITNEVIYVEDLHDLFVRMRPQEADPDEKINDTDSARPPPDPKSVFIIHGRNTKARDEMGVFLRACGLRPLNFSDIRSEMGGTPTIADIVEEGMARARVSWPCSQATNTLNSVLNSEPKKTKANAVSRWQARPNVIFEAGMAFGKDRDRVVFVLLGDPELFTDVAGIHVLKPTNDSTGDRAVLRDTLRKGMKCEVEDSNDWMKSGDFESCVGLPEVSTRSPFEDAAAERESGSLQELPRPTAAEGTEEWLKLQRLLAIIGAFPTYNYWTDIYVEEGFNQDWLNKLRSAGYLTPFGKNLNYYAITGVAEKKYRVHEYRKWIEGLDKADTRDWPLMGMGNETPPASLSSGFQQQMTALDTHKVLVAEEAAEASRRFAEALEVFGTFATFSSDPTRDSKPYPQALREFYASRLQLIKDDVERFQAILTRSRLHLPLQAVEAMESLLAIYSDMDNGWTKFTTGAGCGDMQLGGEGQQQVLSAADRIKDRLDAVYRSLKT